MKRLNKVRISKILGSLAGYSLIGKTGRNGVKEKREELFCALFSNVSGKGRIAGEKVILSIASDSVKAIERIPGELSAQIKQTLQRNIASACNLYLELWNAPAEIKVTTKEITYTVVDKVAEDRLNLLKRFNSVMKAMSGKVDLYDALAFHLAQNESDKKASKMKDEKVEIEKWQQATEKRLFTEALELAVNG